MSNNRLFKTAYTLDSIARSIGRSIGLIVVFLSGAIVFATSAHSQTCYVVGPSQVDGSGKLGTGGPWATYFGSAKAAEAASCAAFGPAWCGTVSCSSGGGVPDATSHATCSVHYDPQGNYAILGLGPGQQVTGSAPHSKFDKGYRLL